MWEVSGREPGKSPKKEGRTRAKRRRLSPRKEKLKVGKGEEPSVNYEKKRKGVEVGGIEPAWLASRVLKNGRKREELS